MTKFSNNSTMNEVVPFIKESVKDGGQFVLFPRGKSMNPTIVEGEDCVVLTELCNVSVYDIVLYRRKSGKYVLHRIMKEENGKYTMCGDNQAEYEKGIEKDCFIAMVTQIRKGDGTVIKHDDIINEGKVFAEMTSKKLLRFAIAVKRVFFKKRDK